MASDPRAPGTPKLAAREDIFRLRIGDYRVLYQVREDVLQLLFETGGQVLQMQGPTGWHPQWKPVQVVRQDGSQVRETMQTRVRRIMGELPGFIVRPHQDGLAASICNRESSRGKLRLPGPKSGILAAAAKGLLVLRSHGRNERSYRFHC